MMSGSIDVHESDPNIFAALGMPDADAHLLKAQVVAELYRLTTECKLTQAKAGELMGISQPEVSRLFRGHFREYPVERLIAFVTAFDRDVDIVVGPSRSADSRGQMRFLGKRESAT